MKYRRPDIGENTLAYRGRRYWIIELAPDGEFEFVTQKSGDYVMWDCLFDNVIAIIKKDADGKLVACLMSHVELTYDYDDIQDAAKSIPAHWDWYCEAIG